MVDWLTFLSALVVVGGFLFLGMFITRHGMLEAQAMLRPVMPTPREIPPERVIGVRNPFVVSLGDNLIQNKGLVHLLLSCSLPCYVSLYWGVKVDVIDAEVHKRDDRGENNIQNADNPEYDDDESSDDYDTDDTSDMPVIRAVPIESILSGSYTNRSCSEFYDPGSNYSIKEEVPDKFDSPIEQRHGIQEQPVYLLVVAIELSRNTTYQQHPIKSCDIVALLTAFNCSKSSSGVSQLQIAVQYIQTADGRLFPLKKLFVADNDQEPNPSTSTTAAQVPNHENITHNLDSFPNATCIVCQSLPVTRVLLPCRHACVCGSCFPKLDSKCPMCRQLIRSYFQTQEEPNFGGTELDASRELNHMSTFDIIRGIFSAS